MTWWRKWDAEIVSILVTLAAAAWMWFAVGCATPVQAAPPRAPSPGVEPHWFPQRWQAPAVLCSESTLVWVGVGWRCV